MTDWEEPIVFETPKPKDDTTEAVKRDLQRMKWREQKRRQRARAKAKRNHGR